MDEWIVNSWNAVTAWPDGRGSVPYRALHDHLHALADSGALGFQFKPAGPGPSDSLRVDLYAEKGGEFSFRLENPSGFYSIREISVTK